MMKKDNFVLIPKGPVTITQKELDALNEYAQKVRRETVKAIFAEVETMLHTRHRIEETWGNMCEDRDDRGKYLYGAGMCEKLIYDLHKIERKYNDETN
jgi:hypothetical protein